MLFFDAGSEFLGCAGGRFYERLLLRASLRKPVIAPPANGLPVSSGHRIAAVTVSHHRLPLDPPFNASWDSQPRGHFDATVVRVRTDDGHEGVASGDRMLGFEEH